MRTISWLSSMTLVTLRVPMSAALHDVAVSDQRLDEVARWPIIGGEGGRDALPRLDKHMLFDDETCCLGGGLERPRRAVLVEDKGGFLGHRLAFLCPRR